MKTGTVHFYSLDTNITGQASVDKTGKFQLENPLPPGEYRVFLGGTARVPEKFRSETSSPYSVSVKEGSNEFSIDLR